MMELKKNTPKKTLLNNKAQPTHDKSLTETKTTEYNEGKKKKKNATKYVKQIGDTSFGLVFFLQARQSTKITHTGSLLALHH